MLWRLKAGRLGLRRPCEHVLNGSWTLTRRFAFEISRRVGHGSRWSFVNSKFSCRKLEFVLSYSVVLTSLLRPSFIYDLILSTFSFRWSGSSTLIWLISVFLSTSRQTYKIWAATNHIIYNLHGLQRTCAALCSPCLDNGALHMVWNFIIFEVSYWTRPNRHSSNI